MKKLTILMCVLAILLAFTGIASASPSQPRKFRIKGQTTGFYVDLGQTEPPCTAIVWSEGKVIRHIHGTFDMEEYLHFSKDSCLSLFQQFMAGQMPIPDYNWGTLTIFPKKGDPVTYSFEGGTDGETVSGTFFYADGTEAGEYEGVPDYCEPYFYPDGSFELVCTGFYVDFTFDTD